VLFLCPFPSLLLLSLNPLKRINRVNYIAIFTLKVACIYIIYKSIVGIIFNSGFRSCDLMSCDSASTNQVAEEVYQHYSVNTLLE